MAHDAGACPFSCLLAMIEDQAPPDTRAARGLIRRLSSGINDRTLAASLRISVIDQLERLCVARLLGLSTETFQTEAAAALAALELATARPDEAGSPDAALKSSVRARSRGVSLSGATALGAAAAPPSMTDADWSDGPYVVTGPAGPLQDRGTEDVAQPTQVQLG